MPKYIEIINNQVKAKVVINDRTVATKYFDWNDLGLIEFMFYSRKPKELEILLAKAHKWADNIINLSYKYEVLENKDGKEESQ